MSDFFELIVRARHIGVHEVAYPIDVFSVATEIAEHPEVRSHFRELVQLVSDPENYFTRWAAVRAINQLGVEEIVQARDALEQQLVQEDYELAANEIKDALSKLRLAQPDRPKYQNIEPHGKSSALAAETADDPRELAVAVIAVALHEADLAFAQEYCIRLAQHSDPGVRGNAILGFGHLARRFRTLDARVFPIVNSALKEPDDYVRGQAYSAADDIKHFLGVKFEGGAGAA